MGKINVLGFDIANLIAAGEVVDRPASVVKELLENAIDAGAKNITVEIRSGGVSRIRVTDDGSGIEYDDLPLTILRHATSKISAASDLAQIFTLGFRGEALAATAAVSKLTIVSKTKDAPLGARLVSEAGEILSLEETGCADGTTVIVDELFANVPARRKFLKKDSTETAAVTGVVEKIALSAPHISIRYVADGECKFQTPGNGDLKGVIYVLFGRDIAGRVRYIEREDGGIRVSGYISEPDFFRPNRNMQNFFINHRYVKSRTMAAAVEQAYNTRIPPDKFPFCVLNLELTPEAVDVNVHPAKLEVKFTNERIIFEAVYYAVLSELEKSGSMPQLEVGSRAARKLANDDGSAAKTGNRSFWVPGADARNLTGAFAPDKKSTKGEQLRVTENTVRLSAEIAASIFPENVPAQNSGRATDAGTEREALSVAENAGYRTEKLSGQTVSDGTKIGDAVFSQGTGESVQHTDFAADHTGTLHHSSPADSAAFGTSDTSESLSDSPIADFASHGEEASERTETAASDIPSSSDAQPASAEKPADESDSAEERSDTAENERIPDYLILGEAYNCYIIVQLYDRLVFIDKHAAHERIIFDSLCDKMKKKNKHSQVLMFPIKVELTENELDAVGEYGDRIRSVGFEFSTVRNGVELTAIPEEISREASTDMIVSLASSLADGIGTVDSVGAEYFDARLYQASCKAAIKGGRVYSKKNLRWICDRVLKVPAEGESAIKTCPHGRPVAFELKRNSIERQFQRLL